MSSSLHLQRPAKSSQQNSLYKEKAKYILKSDSKSKGSGDLLIEELRDASRLLVSMYKLFIATL